MGIPFYGIGAMRSGTTWLSALLRSYPDCAVTPVKELHFFDTRYGVHDISTSYLNQARILSEQGEKIQEYLQDKLARMEKTGHRRVANERSGSGGEAIALDILGPGSYTCWTDEVRRRFHEASRIGLRIKRLKASCDFFSIRDLDSYVDYVTRNGRDAAAFGEITPSYALLPSEAFVEMDSALPGARYIFIMRDPVDRLWSQVCYWYQASEKLKKNPDVVFQRALQFPAYVQRSEYRRTIAQLESVIPADRILYLFFESLVSPESGPAEIRRIESFLGLQPRESTGERFERRVNASSTEKKLSARNEEPALELFAPEYEYVRERFGPRPGWRLQ